MEFDWNPAKSDQNSLERGFSFDFAAGIFDGDRESPGRSNDEARFLAIGEVEGVVIAVVYTDRGRPAQDHFRPPGQPKGATAMGRTLEEIRASRPKIDRAKIEATTEEDIRRYAIEDGEDPDAPLTGFVKRRPGQRGPGKRPAKVQVTLRVDPDVVDAWRASGDGWMARAALVLSRHRPIHTSELEAVKPAANVPSSVSAEPRRRA